MTTLNEQFYAEGWGWLIKGALGIEPEEADLQARAVAKYADKIIYEMGDKASENERALDDALEDARNEVEAADEGRREADARADELTDRVQDLENQLRDAEGRIFDLESGNGC